ncbi:PHO85 interacting cyclin [Komagataella phaffii CBS 7435]|uniref:G1 cyclin, associates with Pho85p cyclin-dependent kinase (Cdk) n=2 Tax=Komagataella phaffii TaxID=460519 RepID=C4R9A7_KOMPG|nr:G1 cyclin, associates with Pho85p cyclin-dependent kinase (Cdk) [Komagataella phaffii GS115]AOA64769.1 GQ67_05314T0 [Komagataella phaffii]CAH2450415.1 PHO85 interacting cyclin [Komagataella phaffii CBS 7435]AOA69600.1 GQ68_05299T0 [Komagataella phaffii GS115]CAY72182.1 G1 cyclin, associates with Pho85p cyclin-dependent kinase (Cdk) [Komagataella phaffii GS115]CCA40206.1 PHO85 interacting cyclin [Komagataella phaffii CBS 7435]
MSDREALSIFLRSPVSMSMVDYLVVTTESVIRLKQETYSIKNLATVPLKTFINSLILHSNVQTNTLMSTLYFLVKLRGVLPPSATGIHASTHHRIFLGCLIVAAKTLNDSSPLNHHWASYTDGLLSLDDVNTLERELLGYFNWDLRIHTNDLLNILAPFLSPITYSLRESKNARITKFAPSLTVDKSPSQNSGHSKTAYCSVSSIPSLISSTSTNSVVTYTSTTEGGDFCHELNLRPLKLSARMALTNSKSILSSTHESELRPKCEHLISRELAT